LEQGHFDIETTEKLMRDYRKNRPAWLKPKNDKKAVNDPKSEENGKFDANRNVSKAEQEEAMTKAVFASARAKTDRGQELRTQFKHNLVERTLQRVKSDLSLNRMFLSPESEKMSNLGPYFEKKMVDPNLDMREIIGANPTKFFTMCHRKLKQEDHLPESYDDILLKLTPEEGQEILLASAADDFRKSPYLTYQPEAGQRYAPREGDVDRWGRRTMTDLLSMVECRHERGGSGEGPAAGSYPRGLGRRSASMSRANIRDSPWMGGGPGPAMLRGSMLKPPPAGRELAGSFVGSQTMPARMESTTSVFVTQTNL